MLSPQLSKRYLLWDFEGTLAARKGRYTSALEAAAIAAGPAFAGTADFIRPFLSGAFPWHGAKLAHPWAGNADGWWSPILAAAETALLTLGMEPRLAVSVSKRSRVDLAGWQVDTDAVEVLEHLSALGWHHAALSNFAPELPLLMEGLGLTGHFDKVFCSGRIGVEKPSPAFFRYAIASLAPGRALWMIGDNPDADIAGGQAVGLSTILVGRGSHEVSLVAETLSEIPEILLKEHRQ
ncbi:MAG: HAD family hydrolase [Alphaproteobacteria bacterium]|jgi:putative hydrolase of the HAD superfamily|nr:MAG: HAD family hydrolase [Alphaproteobacteria bacterium]